MMLTLMIGFALPLTIDHHWQRSEVTVASLNAWLLPFGAADDFDRRRDALPAALSALAPDVVCLQELWVSDALVRIQTGLAHELPAVAVGEGGLAIFSRWPLSDVRFEPYPVHESLSLNERLGNKGYLVALVDTPRGRLRVVDTHLAHRPSREVKLMQLTALAAELAKAPEVPTVLCGDLNVRGGDPSLGALTSLGFVDAAGPRRSGTWGGWPRRPRRGRGVDPDWVMVRDGAKQALQVIDFRQALDTPETALSDHNLQLVRVRMAPIAEP